LSNNEKKPKTNCVFLPDTACPVRASMKAHININKQIKKYIKPVGDAELQKMFAPIFDKMEDLLQSEFGFLHNYCAVCPILDSHFPMETERSNP